MTDDRSLEQARLIEEAKAIEDSFDHRETIYLIESPSPEDLLSGRNEGDALTRVLRLAEINVIYYLCVNIDSIDIAMGDIADRVISNSDLSHMPVIHFSAHGSDDGLELTDGDVFLWDQLKNRLNTFNQTIGYCLVDDVFRQDIPRTILCFSSCGAFNAFPKSDKDNILFQSVIGPKVDIGWCQALIAFSTFYYNAWINELDYSDSVDIMNVAAGVGVKKVLFSSFVPNGNPMADHAN